MKIIGKTTLFVLLTISLSTTASALMLGEHVDYTYGDGEINIAELVYADYITQSFTVGQIGAYNNNTFQLDKIGLHFVYISNSIPSGDHFIIRVYNADSECKMTGSYLFSDNTTIIRNYSDNEWVYFNVTPNLNLTVGSKYVIYIASESDTAPVKMVTRMTETYANNRAWAHLALGGYASVVKEIPFILLGNNGEYTISNTVSSTTTTATINSLFVDNNITSISYHSNDNWNIEYNNDTTFTVYASNTSGVNESNAQYTYTTSSSYKVGDTFQLSLSSLIPAEYYYYIIKGVNSEGTEFTNESYFLTKPNVVQNVQITDRKATNISLSWNNPVVPSGTNLTTIIVYSSSHYPSNISDGTLCYNSTATSTTITNLSIDTTYYFSLWSYINASGSPVLSQISDEHETISATTIGGNYTITFKWECNHTLIDNTSSAFTNSTLWGELYTGQQIFYNNSITENPTHFTIYDNLDIIFFDFNNSGQIRSIIPNSNNDTRNITIFVCCYPTYDGDNLSDSQLFYTFTFDDRTPNEMFLVNTQTEFHLYKYNSSGQYIIHQSYLDAQDQVGVYLHFGERYFIAIKSPDMFIPFVQYIDTDTTTTKEVIIYPETEREYTIYDFVNVTTSYNNGLYINFTDNSFSTEYVNVSIYNITSRSNETLVYQYNFTTSSYNHLWLSANQTYTYHIILIVNNSYLDTEETYSLFTIPIASSTSMTDVDWINENWDTILTMPIPNMTMTQLVSLLICLLVFLSVGIKNGSIALILTGGMLILTEGLIFNEGNTTTYMAVSLGIVMIVLGLIFVRGEIIDYKR